jgi:hypothetical protein
MSSARKQGIVTGKYGYGNRTETVEFGSILFPRRRHGANWKEQNRILDQI